MPQAHVHPNKKTEPTNPTTNSRERALKGRSVADKRRRQPEHAVKRRPQAEACSYTLTVLPPVLLDL